MTSTQFSITVISLSKTLHQTLQTTKMNFEKPQFQLIFFKIVYLRPLLYLLSYSYFFKCFERLFFCTIHSIHGRTALMSRLFR